MNSALSSQKQWKAQSDIPCHNKGWGEVLADLQTTQSGLSSTEVAKVIEPHLKLILADPFPFCAKWTGGLACREVRADRVCLPLKQPL